MFKPVVPGGAGGAMAPPDFGRSVHPISTRGGRFCPSNYNCIAIPNLIFKISGIFFSYIQEQDIMVQVNFEILDCDLIMFSYFSGKKLMQKVSA